MISEDVIQRVKQENDIVEIISEDVKLKKSGTNYFGLCPFHNEKTPSFSVSSSKQIYKCFGCGEAGNVISYVMKKSNVTFPEAVKILAERANINVDINKDNNSKNNTKDKIYQINLEAARYFFNNLTKNKKAVNYFINRGITIKTIKKFGLGYGKDSWDGLLKYLKSKKYKENDMLGAGVIIKGKNNSFYDRFRNRVIFPVFNYRGKVIGFGGRVLDSSKPKYLNSPETEIFKKGINLYGLNYAIKGNNNDTFIIVEGYMDCIALHQFGITNVVASLGTALTKNQAKLLKRYGNRVVISYDSDAAGQMATMRGLEILKDAGLEVKILTVPDGKDPDEFVRKHGKEAYMDLVNNALPLIDYKIEMQKKGLNLKKSDEIIKYVEKVINIIKDLDPIEIDMYIKRLSQELNVDNQTLYDELNKIIRKSGKNHNKMNTLQGFGQKLYVEPTYVKAERLILKILFSNKEYFGYIQDNIKKEDLLLENHKIIYQYIIESFLGKDDIEKRKINIESKCDEIYILEEWVKVLDVNYIYNLDSIKDIIDDSIKNIKRYKFNKKKEELLNKIKKCESEGKYEESIYMSQELVKIQKILGDM